MQVWRSPTVKLKTKVLGNEIKDYILFKRTSKDKKQEILQTKLHVPTPIRPHSTNVEKNGAVNFSFSEKTTQKLHGDKINFFLQEFTQFCSLNTRIKNVEWGKEVLVMDVF